MYIYVTNAGNVTATDAVTNSNGIATFKDIVVHGCNGPYLVGLYYLFYIYFFDFWHFFVMMHSPPNFSAQALGFACDGRYRSDDTGSFPQIVKNSLIPHSVAKLTMTGLEWGVGVM